MSARTRAQAQVPPTGKSREILGICLLGLGVFSALSLVSMHAGSGTMMGPGGRAMARGLYGLCGMGAYFVVGVLLVLALRVFRGREAARSFSEVAGLLGVFLTGTMLLHLPFSGDEVMLAGPGGMVGRGLGDLTVGFVGTVGAVLGASIGFFISVLVLTNVSVAEVADVAITTSARLIIAGSNASRGARRMLGAMFPRQRELAAAENPFEDAVYDEVEIEERPRRRHDDDYEGRLEARLEHRRAQLVAPVRGEVIGMFDADDTLTDDEPPVRPTFDSTIRGMPAAPLPRGLRADDSERVHIGPPPRQLTAVDSDDLRLDLPESLAAEPSFDFDIEERRDEHDDVDEFAPTEIKRMPGERRALSAVVAEVAEVECAALAAAERPEPPVGLNAALKPRLPEVPVLAPVVAPVIAAVATGAAAAAPLTPVAAPVIMKPADKPTPKDDGPGFIRLSEGDFRTPTTDLLEYIPPPAQEIDKGALYEMAARLEQAMSNYGVKGSVSAINMGPVVTMYEFAPAPGTRTGKIAQLENDLAMALEAQAVRIVAPIPGKAVVGVEVPNKNRQTVYLKEILSDPSFRGQTSKLQIALGKDIQGNPVSVNLAKMPHLLVAGTTGSGKSVTVNGMITSLLYNATPEEVRFIMVDPKMLELSIYEGIPHLLLPVVTDPKKANLALRWAVDEMERRYELLSKTGVRDIGSYNAKIDLEEKKRGAAALGAGVAAAAMRAAKKLKVVIEGPGGAQQELPMEDVAPAPSEELREEISAVAAAGQAAERADETPRKLPYIVIVIDEFADLMMVAPKDVETSVARLAQKARAAGLHVILATQRPSVDVITGLIKANFPSRIALQVAGKMDSRVILDQHGAESLLGNGDMLFSDRGTKLRRIHGAFLSDDEVHRVVDFLKSQAKPVYDMDILKPRDDEGAEGEPVERFEDALYDQAVAIVCETRQASVSYIQRRLQIGYNRSARMVEQMERDGIVGPANGIKPREVLAPAGDYLTSAV